MATREMRGVVRLCCAVTALALGLGAAPAHAKPVLPDKQARSAVRIVSGIFVRKLRELNFGTLGVFSAGTATVNANTDALTVTGGVQRFGGFAYAAQFEAVSPSKTVVHIRIPKNSIVVTRIGGTETMTVNTFTISGAPNRNVVAKEPFTFAVGGTLNVNANQAEGVYEGTFEVDLQYN